MTYPNKLGLDSQSYKDNNVSMADSVCGFLYDFKPSAEFNKLMVPQQEEKYVSLCLDTNQADFDQISMFGESTKRYKVSIDGSTRRTTQTSDSTRVNRA